MTDREKLAKLLDEIHAVAFVEEKVTNGFTLTKVFGECLAALLLSHGVTVREPQKPIAEMDLGKYLDTPVWFEEIGRDVEYLPLLLDGIGIYYAEFKEFGEAERLDRRIDDYNYQWRCWAEKPTEEERKAAEWL